MKQNKSEMFGGLILVAFGVLALLAQFVDITPQIGMMILPVIALVFIAGGIFTRNPGYMIPGGIVGGIALGTLLITGPLANLGEQREGGVFMLAFALGWGLITLLTAVFTPQTHRWPLIPGGIMALIGLGLLLDGIGLTILNILGKAWPLALIIGGVLVLYGQKENKTAVNK